MPPYAARPQGVASPHRERASGLYHVGGVRTQRVDAATKYAGMEFSRARTYAARGRGAATGPRAVRAVRGPDECTVPEARSGADTLLRVSETSCPPRTRLLSVDSRLAHRCGRERSVAQARGPRRARSGACRP